MDKYVITAVNHQNPNNHCASSFKMYKYDPATNTWKPLGGKSIGFVSDLLEKGHSVKSGKLGPNGMKTGEPVELELRIAKNDANFKLSDLPTF